MEIVCDEFKGDMFTHLEYTSPQENGSLKVTFFECSSQNYLLQLSIPYSKQSQDVTLTRRTATQGNISETCPKNFPLDKGKATQLTIWGESEKMEFQIYTDQQKWHTLQHKLNYDRVDGVAITLDKKGITDMNMIFGMYLPSYSVGRVVYVHAVAPSNGIFSIDLVSSAPDKYNLNNIPLRIAVDLDENHVTLSHKDKDNKEKGSDQKAGSMPFCEGEAFRMMLFVQTEGFEIGVNGMHFDFFKYRTCTSFNNMSVQLVNVTAIQKIDYY